MEVVQREREVLIGPLVILTRKKSSQVSEIRNMKDTQTWKELMN